MSRQLERDKLLPLSKKELLMLSRHHLAATQNRKEIGLDCVLLGVETNSSSEHFEILKLVANVSSSTKFQRFAFNKCC